MERIEITKCCANQCKEKQWCKRYQLYLHSDNDDTRLWKNAINFDNPNLNDLMLYGFLEEMVNLDDPEYVKLHQFTNDCEYFIPTEQYLIKKKLDNL